MCYLPQGMNATSSVKGPKSRDSHVKTSVLDVSKNEAKKEAVYVRKNKQTDNTFAKVVSNKENVIDVAVANASKSKLCSPDRSMGFVEQWMSQAYDIHESRCVNGKKYILCDRWMIFLDSRGFIDSSLKDKTPDHQEIPLLKLN
ncbi:hypothetical protein Tco_0600289 [Tanacetum coccineum]|uniref:Uncharacterized protein n=1 Tax=Tanacetum coccineum TaxID=301880 RepID=A0ABQ4WBH6_9ASTR